MNSLSDFHSGNINGFYRPGFINIGFRFGVKCFLMSQCDKNGFRAMFMRS